MAFLGQVQVKQYGGSIHFRTYHSVQFNNATNQEKMHQDIVLKCKDRLIFFAGILSVVLGCFGTVDVGSSSVSILDKF